MKTTLAHHIRIRIAVGLEFREDDRAESRTALLIDQAVTLSDLIAAWLTWLLIRLNATPPWWADLGRWWAAYRRGWAEDLRLMGRALVWGLGPPLANP